MTKEQAKEKIQQLIDRYNNLTDSEIKTMNKKTIKANKNRSYPQDLFFPW